MGHPGREKTVYCHTCKKDFHCLGIMQHRHAHKRRREDCMITYTHGDTYEYKYSELDEN